MFVGICRDLSGPEVLLIAILYRIPQMSEASHVEGLKPIYAKHTVGILLFTNKLS